MDRPAHASGDAAVEIGRVAAVRQYDVAIEEPDPDVIGQRAVGERLIPV
jgi:hypothetical protein